MILSTLALLPPGTGCTGGEAASATLTVQDSAGVSMFRAGPGAEVLEWHLGDAPDLVIGPDDGADTGPFFEITGAHRFEDGSIVVASSGTYELRFYSRDGTLQRTVGREGGGPGEFGGINWLQVAADSLWVSDRRYDRISVFDRQGRFGRTIGVQAEVVERFTIAEGVFGSGAVLVSQNEPRDGPRTGLREVYDLLRVFTRDGSDTSLGRYFMAETYWQQLEPGRFVDGGRPFGRTASLVTGRQSLYYTAAEEYRVEQYDMDGTLRAVYARADVPPEVREDDLDAYLARIPGDQEGPTVFERVMRNAPLPERMPAYEDLALDRVGNVWARPHAGAEVRNCWDVYQRAPPALAGLCLPERFRMLDAGDGWVLGVLLDELDVETVAVFALLK